MRAWLAAAALLWLNGCAGLAAWSAAGLPHVCLETLVRAEVGVLQ